MSEKSSLPLFESKGSHIRFSKYKDKKDTLPTYARFLCLLVLLCLIGLYFLTSQDNGVIIPASFRIDTSIYDSKKSPNRVHFITPVSTTSPDFCASLASFLVHDARPVLLGWNGPVYTEAEAVFPRIRHVNRYLQQMEEDNDDIVIITDSYDVWLQKPMESIIQSFVDSESKILMGAEKNCWGLGWDYRENKVCSGVPKSPLPPNIYGPTTEWEESIKRPRWLNPGIIVGYSKALRTLYQDMVNYIDQENEVGKSITVDNGVFLLFYYWDKHGIDLDFTSRVIQSMYASETDMAFAPALPISIDDMWTSKIDTSAPKIRDLIQNNTPWLLFNLITKQFPGLLHFNGAAKDVSSRWQSKMWWSGGLGTSVQEKVNTYLEKFGGANVETDDGPWLTWSELCDKHLILEGEGFRRISPDDD